MTTRRTRLIPEILLATLALLGVTGCDRLEKTETVSNSKSIPVVFECAANGSGWATVAKKGNANTSPLFTWETTEFGPEWTPEQRCYEVSDRLTKAVAASGNSWQNLQITTGKVDNGATVICWRKSEQEICNQENMLVTLNQENAKNPSAALNRIAKVVNNDAYAPPVEEGKPLPEVIFLKDLVGPVLSEGNSIVNN